MQKLAAYLLIGFFVFCTYYGMVNLMVSLLNFSPVLWWLALAVLVYLTIVSCQFIFSDEESEAE